MSSCSDYSSAFFGPPEIFKIIRQRHARQKRFDRFVESVREFENLDLPRFKAKGKIIPDPKEALLTKIMMIRKARYSIDLSYFIFTLDDAGKLLVEELRQAVKRGVEVRILIDDMGSLKARPFHKELQALSQVKGGFIRNAFGEPTSKRATVEVKLFNPFTKLRNRVFNLWNKTKSLLTGTKFQKITQRNNRRSHDKILLIDGHDNKRSMLLTGGRNISNDYYDLQAASKPTFEDMEILLKPDPKALEDLQPGLFEKTMGRYYDLIYFHRANMNLTEFWHRLQGPYRFKQALKSMRQAHHDILEENNAWKELLSKMEAENYLDKDLSNGSARFVNELGNITRVHAFMAPLSPLNPKNSHSIVEAFQQMLKKAQKDIDIVSPYIILTDQEIDSIVKWASEDSSRRFRLVSNSVLSTDNLSAQAMFDFQLAEKLTRKAKEYGVESQIQLYNYGQLEGLLQEKKYGKLHAKFTVVDQSEVLVSTSNLDPRSRYLNSEIGATFKGEDSNLLATQLHQRVEDLVANSHHWGSEEWSQIRNHPKAKKIIVLEKMINLIIKTFNLTPLL